jgi:aminoglycoside N3'-acetyltransferase
MNNLTNKIYNHCNELNIKKGDNVVIHSDISKFGDYSKNLPTTIIDTVFKIIGKKSNIAMPLYNIGIQNHKKNISDKFFIKECNSILSIIFFKNYNPVRSASIIHSHLLKGPMEKDFLKRRNYESFGPNSDFDFFKKNNFKIFLLGCDANEGCTYLHHIEQICKVPYRYKKKLTFFLLNKKINKIKINYYARKKNYKVNLNLIFNKKILGTKLKIAKLKFGTSYAISLKDLDKFAKKTLKKNKKILLK